jgi:hypothetical protein
MKRLYIDICDCECHIEGQSILHCAPCCDLTYEKYITPDGVIDIPKWLKLKTERILENKRKE